MANGGKQALLCNEMLFTPCCKCLHHMDAPLLAKCFRMSVITFEESPFLSIGYKRILSLKFTVLAFKCEWIKLILYIG